jgi:hypothetical protein
MHPLRQKLTKCKFVYKVLSITCSKCIDLFFGLAGKNFFRRLVRLLMFVFLSLKMAGVKVLVMLNLQQLKPPRRLLLCSVSNAISVLRLSYKLTRNIMFGT